MRLRAEAAPGDVPAASLQAARALLAEPASAPALETEVLRQALACVLASEREDVAA